MAGDWIKMRVDLAEDPAVIGVSQALNLEEDLVVGKLHRLWSWANKHTQDGNARSVTYLWLDRYIGATGFCEAMEKEGWLANNKGAVSIPNFDRHNGQSAKRRALTTNRVRNARSVTKALPEKRREEKSNTPVVPKGTSRAASKNGAYESCFEAWWIAYPKHRRTNKAMAYRRYKAAGKLLVGSGRPKADAVAYLQKQVETFAASPLGQTKYAPAPDVWLNKGRYDDDPAAWERGDDSDGNGKPSDDGMEIVR